MFMKKRMSLASIEFSQQKVSEAVEVTKSNTNNRNEFFVAVISETDRMIYFKQTASELVEHENNHLCKRVEPVKCPRVNLDNGPSIRSMLVSRP
jgi:hypothetical protein